MFTITARRRGTLIDQSMVADRRTADELLGMFSAKHRDCEITLKNREHILLTMGPAGVPPRYTMNRSG